MTNKFIENQKKVFIIAEIGVNHNGDIDLAKKMIDSAVESGADAVKFQTFKAEDITTKSASKADYQNKNSPMEDSQFEMLKKLELEYSEFKEINEYCKNKGTIFLSSPFDKDSVDFLDELGVPLFKLGSGEITNYPLIQHIKSKKKPLIISTGMTTLYEIQEVVDFIGDDVPELTIMHCITSYPSKCEETNLNFIKALQTKFKNPIGFSDHSEGIEIPIAAVALGAKVIEKHFTIDKNLDGPDHKASLESKDFKRMVDYIRNVEKSLGSFEKKISPNEKGIKKLVRKSIVTLTDIKKGQKLKEEMLSIKRPGTGIEPKNLENVIGLVAKKDIKKDSLLKWEDIGR